MAYFYLAETFDGCDKLHICGSITDAVQGFVLGVRLVDPSVPVVPMILLMMFIAASWPSKRRQP